MSEFELRILLIEYGSSIDAQFNLWMAVPFAVVIASHTAGDQFNRWGRSALIFLYLLACAVLYFRYLATGKEISSVVSMLREMGSGLEFATYAPYTGFGRRLLMLSGTVFAVLIVVWPTLLKSKR